jgi:hypothetical protein
MILLELFAGSCSFSDEAKKYGYETITVDNGEAFVDDTPFKKIDYIENILSFYYQELPSIDIVWASPPCTYFSVASIGHHWNKDHTPKTKEAIIGVNLVKKTMEIIDYLGPKYWFIENPRGKLRKLEIMKDLPRKTVTYCQYGEERMKPTDIWTNLNWTPKPICKNGDTCHVSAPRGSRTGTQGMANSYEKAKIPKQLCKEILEAI